MQKISVIVPVYNVEKYLERCLNSIVNQSYKNLEILLIDDGSKDLSSEICDEFSKSDNRIKVIHKENEGVAKARNVGLDMATGEYIAFVDSDDYIDLNMFEILMNNMKNTNADISMCDFISTGSSNEKSVISSNVCELSSFEALAHLYVDKDISFVSLWGKIFKKEIFNGVRLPLLTCGEDNAVLYKILYKSNKVVYSPSQLYKYYQRENSAVHTFDESSANDFDLFNVQMKYWKDKNEPVLFRMCFERNFKRLIMTLDCSCNAKKCDDFNNIIKERYEKSVKENIKSLNITPVEKKLYLLDWTHGKSHKFALFYIRLKQFLRNYKFLKKCNLG